MLTPPTQDTFFSPPTPVFVLALGMLVLKQIIEAIVAAGWRVNRSYIVAGLVGYVIEDRKYQSSQEYYAIFFFVCRVDLVSHT